MAEWVLIVMISTCAGKNCIITETQLKSIEFSSFETCMAARQEVLRKHDMISAVCVKK